MCEWDAKIIMYLKNISKAKIKLDTKIVIIKQKPTAGVKK